MQAQIVVKLDMDITLLETTSSCLLKAKIVKPAETAVVKERLCKHVRF
jgi:hypothetical protein